MRPCPSRHRELGELVDGALNVRAAERLRSHLVGCPGCRAEVASLREVQQRLRSAGATSDASGDLTRRLMSIAGPEAAQPLYARPFDARPLSAGPSALPRRRVRARRAMVAVTVTCLLFVSLVGVGWAAAPQAAAGSIDPGPLARDEFAAVLGQQALANPALVAARAVELRERKTGVLLGPEGPTTSLTPHGAREALERADAASQQLTYSGRQLVQVRHLAGFWVADVDIENLAGRGARVSFPGRRGADRAALLPAPARRPLDVADDYALTTGPGPFVAERPTRIVDARHGERLAARWWLDADTDLVLWEQKYDESGATVLSAGYRSVRIGSVAKRRSLPPRFGPRKEVTGLAVSQADDLQRQGWLCDGQLAGLPLIAVRRAPADNMLHTVYGDGVVTVSVIQQRGALSGTPAGFVWDPRQRAHRSLGLTTRYAWQSRDIVFTVSTDGPADLATAAVAELPHLTPAAPSGTGRVVHGWLSLLGAGS
ncbi:MAG: hypothetical protein Q4G46_03905 [Propionibacteriaceae bacterium]|nr:hypothetical protein [Propionibacteriaceae bacterium]